MWVLLTHFVDEELEWREVVPCHMARRGRAGVRLALSGATALCCLPAPSPVSAGGLEWLLTSWGAALRVRVPG